MKFGMTLLTLLIFSLISVSQAKEPANPNPPLEAPTASYSIEPKQIKTVTNDIDYKSMYEVQKGYSSDILSTVYWSLGSILGLLVFFLGSNVFFYYRFNKKGYENFVAETNKRIDEQGRTIEKRLEEKNEEYFGKLELSGNERIGVFSENLEKQIETLEQRIEMVDNKNTANLELVKNSLIGQIEQLDDRVSKDIRDNIAVIKENHNFSKFDIFGVQADIWELKGVLANSLTYRTNQLLMVNSSEVNDWRYDFILQDILNLVKNKKTPLYKNTKSELEEALKKVPTDYNIQVQEILNAVESMKVEEL